MHKYIFKLLIMLCSLAIGGSAWADTVTFTPSDFTGQGTSGYGGTISATKNCVTLACDDGYGTTDIRCYNGSTITISSSNTITALSFSFADSNTGGLSASYTGLSTTSWSKRLYDTPAHISSVVVTYTVNVSIPSHKATFYVNGSIYDETDVEEGAAIGFPTNPGSISGKSFVGWGTSTIESPTDDEPTMVTSANMGNEDRSFYAVYATLMPGDGAEEIVDDLTAESVKNYSYFPDWNNKQFISNAVYAGSSAIDYGCLLLRPSDFSGIVSTGSGGKIGKVTVVWQSSTQTGRTLQVYGKNSAYSSAADLYDDNLKGTLLGTIVKGTNTELTINGDYAYVGLCVLSNTIYFDKISITWSNGTPDTYTNYCTTITAVPVTMGTAGYATFACTEALDLSTLPDGLTAYRAVVDGKTVTFKPISQAVPANTGLLLKGANNGNYEITIANSGAEVEGGNAFLVNTAGTTFSADNDYYYFGLKKDTFTFGTFDPATVAIPANKAYLKIAKSAFPAGARELSLVFEEESTGMDASLVNSEKRILNSEIYDLQGRRVVKPVKGLYIVNGKKVMVE